MFGEYNDESNTKVYALEYIIETLKANPAAMDDVEQFKMTMDTFSVANPYMKSDAMMRYVGMWSFATIGNVKLAFYYLAVILMILCYAGLYRLVHSRLGHLCRSLQQNEELASSIGVNIAWLRIVAYAISSFLGGISGAVFVAISQSIYPSSFQVKDSIDFMLNCFLGGLGYVFGPMLGTLLLY